MASSSNRHWPSMFKSKPCNTHHHHQWQHDINQSLLSSGCLRTPYSSISSFEERSPEPKPRWNPKPEQIRILEAIFNSGMVNPPRDEIRKIRAQLQEYGQVGDANVFYWFQNRKSRSKHKLRHHNISSKSTTNKPSKLNNTTSTTTTTTTNNNNNGNNISTDVIDTEHNLSVVQDQFPINNIEFQSSSSSSSSSLGQGLLLSEIMNHHGGSRKDNIVDHDRDDGDHIGTLELNYTPSAAITTMTPSSIAPLSITSDHVALAPISPMIGQLHGEKEEGTVGPERGESKSTVFINDVAFEVPVGPFNLREAFGEEAVLINSYGHAVLTNEWGLTLHSLHHGAFYYLIYE